MRGEWSKLLLFVSLVCGGCLDPYSPPVSETDVDILVVDGFFDTNGGIATVVLSKAIPLSSTEEADAETDATVTLLDDAGSNYQLHEDSAGHYSVTGVPVHTDAQYRIHIRTQAGNEYQSSLMGVYPTPPIDSVGWITDDDELTIRVNTHDFSNKTKYFRWTYEETWAYHAAVLSQYKVVGRNWVDRQPDEMIFYCWNSQPSTNIIIGSTVRLSENIISQAPLAYIKKGSQKLGMKYSILVSQRGLSEEEYTYLEQLKKTTESVGGLFDPQPSQVPGNIQRLDPSTPLAVGFFGVGNTVKQRIFISISDLPDEWQFSVPQGGCYPPDTVCAAPGSLKICTMTFADLNEGVMLGSAIYKGISLVGITLTSPSCADCRTQGGVLTKPDFWP
ncbi:DUF4249 domain-containing protein [Chryseolinea sp. T2]|uniref:DUF4249 domain-containing protein n=1 Tax=Chryseolinea sp. T2 TaxID=3129255 RepID=UPI0030769FA1